jgi:PIN domain-containing protein
MKKIFIDTNIALDLLFENALYSNFKDIEDGYQYFTAKEYGIPIVVTRNVKDFVVDDISVLTPEQFLSMYRTN